MSGRFPGAADLQAFWQNLVNGTKSIRFFSNAELLAAGVDWQRRSDPGYVNAGTHLEGVDLFDAAFFGFTPREAEIMDPQARQFLECAWEALEDSGYVPDKYKGLIGVFAGKGFPGYWIRNIFFNRDVVELVGELRAAIHNECDSLSQLVAYKLDLRGPSVSVQSFCSTSLVAVHLACQSLLGFECDMALAGGVAIEIPMGVGYLYQEGGILSPDGICRSLDANANGTVMGNGLGVVVLKRLEDSIRDGDHIYAVIRGSAICNDGIDRAGFTAPGVNGQAAAIAAALGNAGVNVESISYVETHGTGTLLGDSVELAAMLKVFREHTDKKAFCAIGSVKPNIGHLDRASGVTSLIKVALALHHKQIPPSLNFEHPNPEIHLAGSPFYVNTDLRTWQSNGPWPLRAGLSSFGLGGTNAHVVLEEVPVLQPSGPGQTEQLLVISAKTEAALEIATCRLAAFLRERPACNLADLAYTLQMGRSAFNYRRVLVCSSAKDAAVALETANPKRVLSLHQTYRNRPIVFLFPGVGEHYLEMGRDLYFSEPRFRDLVDDCARTLQPILGILVTDQLYPSAHPAGSADGPHPIETLRSLDDTAIAEPLVFVIEYSLARLLIAWGLRPQAMLGYSLGEYTAACIAGVLSVDDALKLVAERARLIKALPAVKMLAVPLAPAELTAWLTAAVDLAAHNAPQTSVVAGAPAAIDALAARLTAAQVACHQASATHASHSRMLATLLSPLTRLVQTIRLHPPQIPYLSNVTGNWITPEQATDPTYWAMQMCQPVQFAAALTTLLATKGQVLLEVGPGQALGSFANQHPACHGGQTSLILATLPAAHEPQSSLRYLLETVGKLWLLGVEPDWPGLHAGERRQRLPLPTYPFQRQRFWITPAPPQAQRSECGTRALEDAERQLFAQWFYVRVWRQTAVRNPSVPAGSATWLVLADAQGWGEQIAGWLSAHNQTVVIVQVGAAFRQLNTTHYQIDPRRRADYDKLLGRLKQLDRAPQQILHMWNLAPADAPLTDVDALEIALATGLYSLMYLVQALGELDLIACQLSVIAANAHMVTGAEPLWPISATLIGPTRVIPKEYPTVSCRFIDVSLPTRHTWQAEAFFNNLLGEVLSADFTDTIVALRGHQRWVERFERQSLASLNEHGPALLRLQGVYLITGGLGGIGLALAEHLAQTVQAKLVLVGRTAMPPRAQWAQLLAEHGPDKGIGYKIQRIQRLEELGAEVLLVTADVSNLSQVQMAVQQAMDRFRAVHGVFHAAGVPGVGLVQLKTRETMAQVLAPKVIGTVVLEHALEGIPLDILVLFSSTAAVSGGGPGQFGYASANSFLDAYAVSRQGEKRLTVSIGWNDWQWNAWDAELEGYSPDVRAALRAGRMKYGISFAEGNKAMDLILASRLPHVIVSPLEFNQLIDFSRNFTIESILNFGREQHKSRPRYPRPTLGTSYVAPENSLEQQIADLWGELLGISDIGALDNFFDLGGNSLIGLSVVARLKTALDIKLPVHVLYDAPSVQTLAKYLSHDRGAKEQLFDERTSRGEKRRQRAEQRGRMREE